MNVVEKIKLNNVHHKSFTVEKLAQVMWSVIRAVLVTGICFIILYPLLIKFSVSIMSEKDLYDTTVKYIPKNVTVSNYIMAWRGMDYPKTLGKSFFLSLSTSAFQIISCTLVAYGFARFKFPFKNLIFFLVIVTLLVPPQTIMVPLYMKFRYFDVFGIVSAVTGQKINLIDTFWPYILTSMTCTGLKSGLYIYLLRQHFRGMPKELEEAAYVDGSGLLRTFYKIMLPSAKSMILTVFLFSFVWQWTDTFYATLYLENMKVLPTALSSLPANLWSQYSGAGLGQMSFISPGFYSMVTNTGSNLLIAPLIICFLFAQRYFVESIERSGIVG
jgi:multiple sugar transport system permease protein